MFVFVCLCTENENLLISKKSVFSVSVICGFSVMMNISVKVYSKCHYVCVCVYGVCAVWVWCSVI